VRDITVSLDGGLLPLFPATLVTAVTHFLILDQHSCNILIQTEITCSPTVTTVRLPVPAADGQGAFVVQFTLKGRLTDALFLDFVMDGVMVMMMWGRDGVYVLILHA
jgi:hypothetical protein